ncbi:MAG TPA: 23S rRNA (adenine(2503)-C(2))-methyltransferase RlmN [Chitinophagales bacterium]|nr:23S rRNA (adenine(2503)-C(2))-methyltransferase RlmN [Chitinophagales bacterium]HMW93837.1 23S rRNA (adenine(2503)-C(2))-methyltransferase RlmN [Chitinophagales bacterium]HMZ69447.1 23S rRNA (adenine(2503)-C(2))-methyltransferase RlmN [Chitinophagales bacterium]HMZ94260.1 23S rRNA (adenine(2503)-C(2))-methyltransferase RlmN [Chitinophagales bacterium]HNB38059.1 23S rRNA (adenine(2503)-C(2))-methyltransferase RlmN [Chitinophagales bacterium]
MMTNALQNIRQLSLDELQAAMKDLGEPKFRAKQIYEWLWKKSVTDFEAMTNLSKPFREKLAEKFTILPIKLYSAQHSNDGTIKTAFQLHDKHFIEGVLIPSTDRATACVSSQVGCSLACKFCATGFLKRERNLEADEIYDQVVFINRQAQESLGRNLTNIVFMGMGEPLLNYSNVMEAINKITSEDGLNMAAKRITVSTAGISKMIKKMADDGVRFNLALSLHAADDEKRNAIMPINEQNNIASLMEALIYFEQKTKSEITFEYILMKEVNDSIEDAKNLVALCKQIPNVKVNLIEYNTVEGVDLQRSSVEKQEAFSKYLSSQRVIANIRRSRGKDIDAACGQLANKMK